MIIFEVKDVGPPPEEHLARLAFLSPSQLPSHSTGHPQGFLDTWTISAPSNSTVGPFHSEKKEKTKRGRGAEVGLEVVDYILDYILRFAAMKVTVDLHHISQLQGLQHKLLETVHSSIPLNGYHIWRQSSQGLWTLLFPISLLNLRRLLPHGNQHCVTPDKKHWILSSVLFPPYIFFQKDDICFNDHKSLPYFDNFLMYMSVF